MEIHHYFLKEDKTPSMPDTAVMSLYDRMVDEGTARIVFEDGAINSREGFLAAMKTGCRLHVVVEFDQPMAAVWLNRFEGKMARLHFCFFKAAWGARSEEVGRFALSQLLNMSFDDEYVYDCFIGYVPDKNKAARMFFHKMGVWVAGHLPMGHWNAFTQKSEPCTIVYVDRGCL